MWCCMSATEPKRYRYYSNLIPTPDQGAALCSFLPGIYRLIRFPKASSFVASHSLYHAQSALCLGSFESLELAGLS